MKLADGRKIEWVDEQQQEVCIDGEMVSWREIALYPEKYLTVEEQARRNRRKEETRQAIIIAEESDRINERNIEIAAKVSEGIPLERVLRGIEQRKKK